MVARKDIWRVGIAHAPLGELLREGTLKSAPVTWLPDLPPLHFAADPFGLWRDGKLYILQEIFNYRDRLGKIEAITLDSRFQILDRRLALEEPWHLSYPFLIEDGGETYMLPEAHRSGRLTLYRAVDFPTRWTAVQTIDLDKVPIDATPVHYNGLWWMFYTPATTREEKVSALHVAFAQRLMGPWTPHALNPVRFDASSARPGGTPLVVDGGIILPVQDCTKTYGGAMRALRIHKLTPEAFEATAGAVIGAPNTSGAYDDGFHTLSAVGALTLVDVKRFQLSAQTLALDVRHFLRKTLARGGR